MKYFLISLAMSDKKRMWQSTYQNYTFSQWRSTLPRQGSPPPMTHQLSVDTIKSYSDEEKKIQKWLLASLLFSAFGFNITQYIAPTTSWLGKQRKERERERERDECKKSMGCQSVRGWCGHFLHTHKHTHTLIIFQIIFLNLKVIWPEL